jgi:hypothetical protein
MAISSTLRTNSPCLATITSLLRVGTSGLGESPDLSHETMELATPIIDDVGRPWAAEAGGVALNEE